MSRLIKKYQNAPGPIINQWNQEMKDYATNWYTQRVKQDKYKSQLSNLDQILGTIDKSKYVAPNELLKTKMGNQFTTDRARTFWEQIQGFADPSNNTYTYLPRKSKTTRWHEGIGHIVGDTNNQILQANPSFRSKTDQLTGNDYEQYINQANERHAETWGFRGANRNLKDNKGNLYIDPNRQLSGDEIQEMINKGAIIPDQFKELTPEQIAILHNAFAQIKSKNNEFYIG